MTASEIAYLFAIKELAAGGDGGARCKFVAEKLHFSRASASRALDKLCVKRMIRRTAHNGFALTEAGAAAVETYDKCVRAVQGELIARFGCRESAARADALRVVCALSEENLKKLAQEE
ncbi:MAG: hypothetical protein DBX59_03365 [Bacillota bacterium]|nr:MAG: hypothetical protein DBX59_03365 [Bacillota bacterium]